jgi:hypothetical protein
MPGPARPEQNPGQAKRAPAVPLDLVGAAATAPARAFTRDPPSHQAVMAMIEESGSERLLRNCHAIDRMLDDYRPPASERLRTLIGDRLTQMLLGRKQCAPGQRPGITSSIDPEREVA